jgi:hypothetical protein
LLALLNNLLTLGFLVILVTATTSLLKWNVPVHLPGMWPPEHHKTVEKSVQILEENNSLSRLIIMKTWGNSAVTAAPTAIWGGKSILLSSGFNLLTRRF